MKWIAVCSAIAVGTWLIEGVFLSRPPTIYLVALIVNLWAGYVIGRNDERARRLHAFMVRLDDAERKIEESDDGMDSAGHVDNKRPWQGGRDRA